jgi:hypothetical protein
MIKYRTATKKPLRKAKKSYTLSPESVEFLEAIRKKRRTHSTSAVLDEILQTIRRGQKRKAIEKAVADFYDSLSSDEIEEHARWGEFALGEFPNEVA